MIVSTLGITKRLYVRLVMIAALVTGCFLAIPSQLWSQVNFTPIQLSGVELTNPTVLQFGPDNRLYVAQKDGLIFAYTVERLASSQYLVSDVETIDLVKFQIPNFNDDGTFNSLLERQVTGMYVSGTSESPIIYVSSSDMRIGAGGGGADSNLDTNSGVISRLTFSGGSWQKVDLIRGLPRSEENHSVNGLLIDPYDPDILYLAYGGNTNAGAPSSNFAFLTEFAYSNAILKVDLKALESMPINNSNDYGHNLQWVYDLPTLDDPTRPNLNGIDDPNQPGYDGIDPGDPFGGNDGLNQAKMDIASPVQIHSSGWRNLYDLVITTTPGREGRMYAVDNGANPDWGGHPEGESDYPAELTTPIVTNNYIQGEPGSLGPGPGGDPVVNNLNGLHYVRTLQPGDLNYVEGDPFNNQIYYAGHPNPIRANPLSAGLFTKGTHTISPDDGGDAYWRHEKLDVTNPNFSAQSLPVDWPPVPSSLANPAEGDFRNAGVDDGAIAVYSESTNGICEYTASNFGGALQGDLLMAGFNGSIYRATLSPDGKVVDNCPQGPEICNSTIASGFGSLPLDVIALGDDGVFPGTIWAITFGDGAVTVFEPADYDGVPPSPCAANILSYQQDSDGDGYTDADEADNGSDPCSAASQPLLDFDGTLISGFKVSNLNDPDDDDDGILDVDDPFVWDPENGKSLELPVFNEFFNEQGAGIGGIGLTGLMTNGTSEYHEQYNSDEVILGGTSGLLTIPATTSGDAFVNNQQDNAFQFGVNVDVTTGVFIVKTKINGPFFNNNTPVNWQSQGFYIGTGDQNNYLKLVLTANNGAGGFEVLQEQNGSISAAPHGQSTYSVSGLLNANSIELVLQVDPSSGVVQPQYAIDGGEVMDLGSSFSLQGALLQTVQGNYSIQGVPCGLAVGVISTSFDNQPEFTGTWDYIKITTQDHSSTILVDQIQDQVNDEGEQPVLSVSASGGGANLNYSAFGLPDGLSIEPTNGQIIGTINQGASTGGAGADGVHSVTITVDDGGLSSSVQIEFQWTIQLSQQSWELVDNLNQHIPRHENSFAQVGDKFYLLGGRETNQVEIYDYASKSWSVGASAPFDLHHFQAVAHKGYIWAITGFGDNNFPSEQPVDSIYIYDPVQDLWVTGAKIPEQRRRGSAGAVVYDDKFYVVGGIQNGHTDGWVTWFDEYDPQTNTWKQLPDAPRARDHFHAVVLNDKLYVTGGRRSGEIDTYSPTIAEVDVYDFNSGSWLTTNLPDDLPVPRAGASSVAFMGDLLVIGGEGDGQAYALTDALDISLGTWSSREPLNTARHGTQAIASESSIYITSGSPVQGGGNLNSMEVLGGGSPVGVPLTAGSIQGPSVVSMDISNNVVAVNFQNLTGNQSLLIHSVDITGADAGSFNLTNNNPVFPVLIDSGSTLQLEIAFAPETPGMKTASLDVIYNGSQTHNTVLNGNVTGASCTWTSAAPSSGTKNEGQTAVVNNKLYVFAAFTEGLNILDFTEMYDPVRNQWEVLSPMPVPVTHVGNVVVGEEVWFAGGFVGDHPGAATDVVQIYNTLHDTWSTGPSLPAPRGGMAMALIDNSIHVFGGLMPDRNTDVGDHYVLDLENQQLGWQSRAPMPSPRNHHAGIAHAGKAYAIGGQFGHDSSVVPDVNLVHAYDPLTDSWTRLADLPVVRSHFEPGIFTHDDLIFITGGRSDDLHLDDISYYDPVTDQWQQYCDLPVSLLAPGAKVIGNKLIVTNGALLPLEPQSSTYVTTLDTGSLPPLVSAGFNTTVDFPLTSIILDGQGLDPDGGTIVNYQWTQLAGPSDADLSNENTASPTVENLVEGEYIFRLTVTDNEGNSGYDDILVRVTGGDDNQEGVSSFTLIDANTDQPISGFDPIPDGAIINLSLVGTNQLNIRANTNPSVVGSVAMFLQGSNGGSDNQRVENVAPYALFGDSGGDFASWTPAPQFGNSFQLTGIAYDQSQAKGLVLGETTINFSFTDQSIQQPPVANAGTDRQITLPLNTVNLAGTGNDPDGGAIVGYLWNQIHGPSQATLGGINTPNITASDLVAGEYIFTLTVTDDEGTTGIDEVSILVNDGQVPIVSAGDNQSIVLPVNSIVLNGTASDPDGGSIVSYSWSEQDGPAPATLLNTNTSALAASNLEAGTYTFRLTATDDEGETSFDDVQVMVTTQLPVVNAGANLILTSPVNSATLSGLASDPDGGNITNYIWTQQEGPNMADLSGQNTANLSVGSLIEGIYLFRLTVTDDEGETAFDEVQVTVNAVVQQGVVSFSLINAETDQPIAGYEELSNGQQIDLSTLGTDQLNIRANTNPTVVGSVKFNLLAQAGGSDYIRTENGAPYALFGDIAGDFDSWLPGVPQAGDQYSLTATAYSSGGGNGSVIGSQTLNFSFINVGVVNNAPVVNNPGNQSSTEGDNILLSITANDGDQGAQSLTYSAVNLPPGLNINPNTGQISGELSTANDNPGSQEQNGLVIIEMESVPLANNWTQGTDGSITYYEATQDNFGNPVSGGILQYQVNISNPGIYRFEWRSKINQGDSHTDSNDNWLKFPNNSNVVFFGYQGTVTSEAQLDAALQSETGIVFPKGSGLEGPGTTPEGSGADGYFKVYMNDLSGWLWSARTSDNDIHDIYVKFINPGTYTMEISNRSAGHAIDRMALYKIDTYGDNYSDNLLTNAPTSSIEQSGAADNSPYQVQVTVTDSGAPPLSTTVNFTWTIDEQTNPNDPTPPNPADMGIAQDQYGRSSFTEDRIEVYPNPVTIKFSVKSQSLAGDKLSFYLHNVLGSVIHLGERSVPVGVSENEFYVNNLGLAVGTYYLRIISASSSEPVFHQKLIIQ